MNNREVQDSLEACSEELDGIRQLLIGIGDEARPSPFMRRYAVIRASGAIEVGFKKIIADRVGAGCDVQVTTFLKRKIVDSSINPKLGAIQNTLSDFDPRWRVKFDELIGLGDKPGLTTALTVLVNARNEFAHGGSPDINILETIEHFKGGFEVLKVLDQVVHHVYEEGEDEPVMDELI